MEGKDFRYLARVLRLRPGDEFQGMLPSGEDVSLRVISLEGQVLSAGIVHGLPTPGDPDPSLFGEKRSSSTSGQPEAPAVPALPPIILCQGLPKGQKMDAIVRQTTELGVSRIVPFISQYSIPKVQGDAARQRKERWDRIVKEARQQSGSPTATTVDEPRDLSGVLELWRELRSLKPGAVGILLHQDPLAQGTLHGYLSGSPEAVFLAVGPEGGFSGQEADRFMAEGFKPLRLGENVLRTETAAVTAAAATYVLLLEQAFWKPSNGLPA